MTKRNITWRLIYPNKEESIMNYNPIIEERKSVIEDILKMIDELDLVNKVKMDTIITEDILELIQKVGGGE